MNGCLRMYHCVCDVTVCVMGAPPLCNLRYRAPLTAAEDPFNGQAVTLKR